ncbi:MAG: sigma-54-dependent Fis family transcriptional regulator [Desulfotomaculaceae bacterium]|nr:sigma-54-dependent Fis family transcriptional regulator [Desulfotomaculaceae bacterium]
MSCETDVYAEIREEWGQFIKHGKIPASSIICSEILKSWERSRKLKVDPYQGACLVMLSPSELAARKSKNADLLAVAEPIMEELYRFVARSQFIVGLVDADGYLIKIVGDPQSQIGSFTELNEGNNLSEEVLGTNGYGTPLVTGRPIQIHGAEHYCLRAHYASCSGTPVRGPEDNIIGVLVMSGKKELTHLHTLGMVVAATNAIHNELKIRNLAQQKQIILESLSEGILVLDGEGYITYLNPAAARILEVDGNLVGRKLEGLGGKTNNNFMQIINRCENVTDELVDIDLSGETVKVSLTLRPMNVAGRNSGMVIVVSERKRIRQIINKFVGMTARYAFSDIIGKEKSLLEAIKLARKVADSESTVLITGESGTGKEVFAQAIHNASSRREYPFVAINCAAIPRELLASELFGYDEGAFTGARRGGNVGKFELADGGTLFLDEIGDMPLDMQVVLLRVIEEKNLIRIGGKKSIPVNVRIIAATNKNLPQEVSSNHFRADLYYRLNVININLPPLRERKGDIPLLVSEFASRILGGKVRVENDAQLAFLRYPWPGNIRELQNIIESALATSDSAVISLSVLPENIRLAINFTEIEVPVRSNIIPLKRLESDIIKETIEMCNGNVTLAAKRLGINRSTIYRKMGLEKA